jgi:hypothetical protein
MAAKKRKPKPFRASKAVKAAARQAIGTPPPTRAEPADTRRKQLSEKYKPKLEDLMREDAE